MVSRESIEKLIRPDFRSIRAYEPIEPTDILSQRTEIAPEDVIKLDGNENLYGCSVRVKRALADYNRYHIYPDPEQRELKKALSKHTGVDSNHILAGSGSDELIDLILRLFIEPGDGVINCPPTFGMYPFCTQVCGGEIVNIPRNQDFSINVTAIKQVLGKQAKVVFITSPNNPSGNLADKSQVMELLDTAAVIVIDEAYAEFSGVTMLSMVADYSNLIVLRTFSKWAGLAGLRMGYGIFPAYITEHLMKIKQPYNVNIAAQIAALESLKDIDYLQNTIKAIVKERKRLSTELSALDWLKIYPTEANFVLCSVLNGKAGEIHQKLKSKGIFIRHFNTPELKDYLRISVGKPEHTDKLIAALKEFK
jgi:histidinol-phosphate aminotransferase